MEKLVNNNFDRFNHAQQKHKSTYIGNKDTQNPGGFNQSNYNSQEDTDKSIGASGRNPSGKQTRF